LADAVIEHFWEAVPPVWHAVRQNLRRIASEKHGITVEQYHILRHILRGASSVSQLAELREISPPAISQLVDALVEKKLILRGTHPSDRRRIHLSLTAQGQAVMHAIFEENHAWMRSRLSCLQADQLRELAHGLEILRDAHLSQTS